MKNVKSLWPLYVSASLVIKINGACCLKSNSCHFIHQELEECCRNDNPFDLSCQRRHSMGYTFYHLHGWLDGRHFDSHAAMAMLAHT
jgi:hypothetical protein